MNRRSPHDVDPHLDLKIGLFFVAAVLGLTGMLLARPLLIYAAMVAIGLGLLLRFLRRRTEDGTREAPAADPPPGNDRTTGDD